MIAVALAFGLDPRYCIKHQSKCVCLPPDVPA